MLQITSVDQSNYHSALEVYTVSWRQSHEKLCTPAFLKNRDYAGYLRKRLDGLYLIIDQVPVGVFYLLGEDFGDLYIHPQHQGSGYGTAAIQFAKEQSKLLRLTVLSTNTVAIRLYEKMGFSFTGRDTSLRNGLTEREMKYMEKYNG